MLKIEIEGGLPHWGRQLERTVEPSGDVALGGQYGFRRISVAGKTLAEAGERIKEYLQESYKSPMVLVTYAGHDSGIAAADAKSEHSSTSRGSDAPFTGRIRPGDMLNIEIENGLPVDAIPPRTVEPDGTVALLPAYDSQRVNVAGKTLIEAGNAIEERVRRVASDATVLVTYLGHDSGIAASGLSGPAAATPASVGRAPGVSAAGSFAPFSGQIRPGDILDIEIQGGLPTGPIPPAHCRTRRQRRAKCGLWKPALSCGR